MIELIIVSFISPYHNSINKQKIISGLIGYETSI